MMFGWLYFKILFNTLGTLVKQVLLIIIPSSSVPLSVLLSPTKNFRGEENRSQIHRLDQRSCMYVALNYGGPCISIQFPCWRVFLHIADDIATVSVSLIYDILGLATILDNIYFSQSGDQSLACLQIHLAVSSLRAS